MSNKTEHMTVGGAGTRSYMTNHHKSLSIKKLNDMRARFEGGDDILGTNGLIEVGLFRDPHHAYSSRAKGRGPKAYSRIAGRTIFKKEDVLSYIDGLIQERASLEVMRETCITYKTIGHLEGYLRELVTSLLEERLKELKLSE